MGLFTTSISESNDVQAGFGIHWPHLSVIGTLLIGSDE